MRQRGYPSAASRGVSLRLPGKRPEPPSQLSPEEAKEWVAIAGGLPPDFFPREVQPLLTQVCRREVSPSNPEELATYGKLLTLEMALSGGIANLLTKLRCTNQSRYATRTAERQAVKARTKPWDVINGGKSGENLPLVSDDGDDWN
jgi:hypothetical protein